MSVRGWLATHGSKTADPNKWVFFGVAWAATVGGMGLTFLVYTSIWPSTAKPPPLDINVSKPKGRHD